MKKLFLITLFIIGSSPLFSQGYWSVNTSFTGAGRTFPATFTIGDYVYIVNGLTSAAPQTPVKETWQYDPANDTWTQMADFGGNARWASFGFSVDGYGYVGCGRDNVPTSYDDMYAYDTSSNTWTQKTSFPGGARRGCGSGALNGKGYVGMGWNGATYYDDWYEYDPSNDSWTSKASYPYGAVNYPTFFTMGDKIYIGNGYDNSQYLNDFYKYDPVTDAWTQINSMGGNARYGAGAFIIGEYVYIAGGGTQTATNITDVWRYDTVSGNWAQAADLPGGTRYNVGFGMNGKGYIAMGDSNNTMISKLYVFDTTSLYVYNSSSVCMAANIQDISCLATAKLDSTNSFILQLSDANGDFTTPTDLDTLYSDSGGVFNFIMPTGLTPGLDYRIRVVSSLPAITSLPQSLTVKPVASSIITGYTTNNVCGNDPVSLYADTSSINYETYPLEIIYDASQGQSGLQGASKVYIHSALTDTNATGASWYYTTGNWGMDDGIGKMDSLGNDLWKIVIDVPVYYKCGYATGTRFLVMTFRNEDGTLTGKSSSGGDIYVAIHGNAPSSSSPVTVKYVRNYQWYKDGNAIAGATNTQYDAYTSGDYSLQSGGLCASLSSTVSISTGSYPDAGFTISADNMCLQSSGITFTDTTQNGQLSRSWDFGDGNTSNQSSITHVYTAAGIYLVKMISSNNGCRDTAVIQVEANPLPTVTYGLSSNALCLKGNNFTYTANSSVTNGNIASNNWKFGDGMVDTGTIVSHIYNNAGNYTAWLIALTDKGCSDSVSNTLIVHPDPDQKMYINADIQCLQGNNFSFIDSSSIISGSITSHDWNFGDGGTSTSTVSPTHSYKKSGSYIVQLINTSNFGCTDTLSRTVQVVDKPNANITPSGTISICQGQNVTLKTLQSTGLNYVWYKDGSIINGQNSDSLVIADSGIYHVVINAPGGCGDTSNMVSIKVIDKPVISSIQGENAVTAGSTKTYSVTQIAGVNYIWTVSGGTISSGQGTNSINVVWSNSPGSGNIMVTANCADSVTLAVNLLSGFSNVTAGNIHLFPNPAHNNITLSGCISGDRYIISDLSGKIYISGIIKMNHESIELESISQGTYVITLITKESQFHIRFVRQ